jgi:hypothetical protein
VNTADADRNRTMGQLIVTAFVTADGVAQALRRPS